MKRLSFLVLALTFGVTACGPSVPESDMPWNQENECSTAHKREVLRKGGVVTVRCLNRNFKLEGPMTQYDEEGNLIDRKYYVDGVEQEVTR